MEIIAVSRGRHCYWIRYGWMGGACAPAREFAPRAVRELAPERTRARWNSALDGEMARVQLRCEPARADGLLAIQVSVVRKMRLLPFEWRDVVRLVVIAATPFLPLLLTVFSLEAFATYIIKAIFCGLSLLVWAEN